MKKVVVIFVCALTLFFCVPLSSFPAEANSAAPYSAGITESGIVVLDDSPVQVKKEVLTFYGPDASRKEEEKSGQYLTAEYTFYNPTDMDVVSRAVFPFTIHHYDEPYSFRRLGEYDDVQLNGQVISKNYRCTYFCGSFDYDKDVGRLSDEYLSSDYLSDDFFRPETEVYIYRCKVEGYSNVEYRVTLSNQIERNRRLMLSSCVDRTTDEEVIVDVYSSEFDLISFGGPLDETPVIDAYKSNSSMKKKIDRSVSIDLKKQTTFLEYIAEKFDLDIFSLTDRYNVVMVGEKEYPYPRDRSESSGVYCRNIVLNATMCILCWYEYEISFPKKTEIINTVTAPLVPSASYSVEPIVYTYSYLWSPAKTWASFSDLTVNIVTDYYLLYQSTEYDFEKTENGYTLHLDALPEEGELEFELCQSPAPKRKVSGRDVLSWVALGGAILGGLAIFTLIVIAVFSAASAIKRKKSK